MKSVILTGDAGMLPLSKSHKKSKQSSGFNICCTNSCSGKEEQENETNLKPIKRRTIKKNPVLKNHGPPMPWTWSQGVI